MELRPIRDSECELVAHWLGQEENYRWLHFGPVTQIVTEIALRVMLQREIHLLRAYTSDGEDEPIGVVALSDIDPEFRTATLWYVLGDKRHAGRGYTTRAVSRLLTVGFRDLGLASVQAWTVETNVPGIRVLQRNRFRFIGRLRKCHVIHDRWLDRLLYDLVAAEHRRAAVLAASKELPGPPSTVRGSGVLRRSCR